jgi:hypothetical protein
VLNSLSRITITAIDPILLPGPYRPSALEEIAPVLKVPGYPGDDMEAAFPEIAPEPPA